MCHDGYTAMPVTVNAHKIPILFHSNQASNLFHLQMGHGPVIIYFVQFMKP